MFKPALKLTIMTVVFLAACTILFGGKTEAFSTGSDPRCPDSQAIPPPTSFGFNQGEQYDGYAGLTVTAYYGSDTDGHTSYPAYHQAINTQFRLHSQLPDLAPWQHYINKTGDSDVNPNARLFQLNAQDPYGDPDSRTAGHDFTTGTDIYTVRGNNGSPFACNGLAVLGPGSPVPNPPYKEWGNRWGLDCGEGWTGNGLHGTNATNFWIDNLPLPSAGGYWTIQTDQGQFRDGEMNFNNHPFTVTNGVTQHVYLIWHPQAQQGNPSANCSKIDEYNYGNYSFTNDAGVLIKNRPTRTLVETSNPGAINNDNGGAIYAYAPGSGGSTTKSDQIWNITATAGSFTYYTTRQFLQTDGNWGYIDNNGNRSSSPSRNAHTVSDCYHASCSNLQILDGQGPGGVVVGGQQFRISLIVRNDNTSANAEPIPSAPGGFHFSITESPDDNQGGFAEHDVGTYLNVGGQTTMTIPFRAPDAVRDFNINLYPDLYGSGGIGGGCPITVPVFKEFRIGPSAQILSGTNPENPYVAGTTTHGVSYSVGGSLQFGPSAIGATTKGWLTKNSAANIVDGPHVTADSYGNVSHQYNYPDNGFVAGDQYCPHVTVSPAHGFRGPHSDVGNEDGTVDGSCITVVNEPYFKAYNSGLSARDGVTPASGACSATSSNSGLLAGWNDNLDYGGAERGAGSQLSAIALIKITGVASAQTDIARSATDLTFANNNAGDITQHVDSPFLGGNFGGQPKCNNAPPINATAALGGTSGVPAGKGTYQRSGNLTLTGGLVDNSGATAIKVNGDVFINGNISYGANPSWTYSPGQSSGPSFVIVATGNIYIAPNVTQLDGMYVAQPRDATHGGTIYTCAPSSNPPGAGYDYYHNCGQQLLVNGSFEAANVKLLRTFGSLRNEEPNPPAAPGSQSGLAWTSAGPPSGPLPAGYNCTFIDEPSDPNTWYDNYLCLPGGSSLRLAWTHYDNNPNYTPSPGWYTVGQLAAQGFPYCTKLDIPADYSHTWYDNSLCMNQRRPDGTAWLHFSTSNLGLSNPNEYCTNFNEYADPDGQWAGVGYFLCEPKAAAGHGVTPSGPPFLGCSNAIAQITSRTCGAEVFQSGPEMYLQKAATQPLNNGATNYDAITSLPPVL